MSAPSDAAKLELHLFAPERDEAHVKLLAAIAHYHRTGRALGLGHTVDFGRSWILGSRCDHGMISLPYLDGPILENLDVGAETDRIRFLWLIPITAAEVEFAKTQGREALERESEKAGFDYLDPNRPPVVGLTYLGGRETSVAARNFDFASHGPET